MSDEPQKTHSYCPQCEVVACENAALREALGTIQQTALLAPMVASGGRPATAEECQMSDALSSIYTEAVSALAAYREAE